MDDASVQDAHYGLATDIHNFLVEMGLDAEDILCKQVQSKILPNTNCNDAGKQAVFLKLFSDVLLLVYASSNIDALQSVPERTNERLSVRCSKLREAGLRDDNTGAVLIKQIVSNILYDILIYIGPQNLLAQLDEKVGTTLIRIITLSINTVGKVSSITETINAYIPEPVNSAASTASKLILEPASRFSETVVADKIFTNIISKFLFQQITANVNKINTDNAWKNVIKLFIIPLIKDVIASLPVLISTDDENYFANIKTRIVTIVDKWDIVSINSIAQNTISLYRDTYKNKAVKNNTITFCQEYEDEFSKLGLFNLSNKCAVWKGRPNIPADSQSGEIEWVSIDDKDCLRKTKYPDMRMGPMQAFLGALYIESVHSTRDDSFKKCFPRVEAIDFSCSQLDAEESAINIQALNIKMSASITAQEEKQRQELDLFLHSSFGGKREKSSRLPRPSKKIEAGNKAEKKPRNLKPKPRPNKK